VDPTAGLDTAKCRKKNHIICLEPTQDLPVFHTSIILSRLAVSKQPEFLSTSLESVSELLASLEYLLNKFCVTVTYNYMQRTNGPLFEWNSSRDSFSAT